MTTTNTQLDCYDQALAIRELAARELYEAELALHDAHQTRVDKWIEAASDHLHDAVVRYIAAETALATQARPRIAA
jgi:hypothetical protein